MQNFINSKIFILLKGYLFKEHNFCVERSIYFNFDCFQKIFSHTLRQECNPNFNKLIWVISIPLENAKTVTNIQNPLPSFLIESKRLTFY